ncbi:MAG: Rid family hydrolase [Acidimicrobiales bacterium]
MSDRTPIIPAGQEAYYERFHFAPAMKVGNTVYLSGIVGAPAGAPIPDDPAEEFAAVFSLMDATLVAAGGSIADVVELTSYHTDMSLMGAFMKAKDAAIGEPYPAWTAIGCTGLAQPGARVEVKATAVLDG